MDEERYLQEKQFHNSAYSEAIRDRVAKYYKIAGSRVKLYEALVYSRCRALDCRTAHILELGVGPEGLIHRLADVVSSAVAIDISEVAIERAIEAAGNDANATFRVMNAEALEFENETFEIILGTAIIHHLNLPKAYAEVARTLKPNGFAIFMEPLGHNPLINLYRAFTPRLRTEDEQPLVMKDLKLARCYFSEVDVYYFHLLDLLAVPLRNTRYFDSSLGVLQAIDRFVFRHIPAIRKYAWYSVMVLGSPK